MTRSEMEAVIRDGRVILHEGRMISKIEDLPTTADLAGQDVPKLQAELVKCEKDVTDAHAKRDKVKAQLAEALAAAKASPAPTPAPQAKEKAKAV